MNTRKKRSTGAGHTRVTIDSKPVKSASARRPGRGNTGQDEPNSAPSQWGRRLARAVGEKFGVVMVENHARNEGTLGDKGIIIKCAKSPMPPVSVLADMLDRLDQLWAVYIMPAGHAQVWAVDIKQVRKHGYFTRGLKAQRRVEIYLKTISEVGEEIGEMTVEEVDACRIP